MFGWYLNLVFILAPNAMLLDSYSYPEERKVISIMAILPDHSFYRRSWTSSFLKEVAGYNSNYNFKFTDAYLFQGIPVFVNTFSVNLMMREICWSLSDNLVTILYLTNPGYIEVNTRPLHFIREVATYLGLPLITWTPGQAGVSEVYSANMYTGECILFHSFHVTFV